MRRRDLAAEPAEQLRAWLDEATAAGVADPAAAVLATVGADGRPATRVIPIREVGPGGLVAFTSARTAKARHLRARPDACSLLFAWPALRRQVRIDATAQVADGEEADRWFTARPRAAQVGAWVPQGPALLDGREHLVDQIAATEARFAGVAVVPRPDDWVVVRFVADRYEFWQADPSRAHDRICYRRAPEPAVGPDPVAPGWIRERLRP